jgi:hypothetical protein
MFCGM